MVIASGARAIARCRELGAAPFSQAEDRLFRPYLSDAHAAAVDRIALWMGEAGMAPRVDPAANLIGRYEARRPDAPALLIGSHIDNVRDAGCFDGPLGVLLGVECAARLHAAGRRLAFAIEVIAFGDEEGSRFPASMLCSRAVAGGLDPAAIHVCDGEGMALADAMRAFRTRISLPAPEAAFETARRLRQELIGYLEPHIEQGPVLEAEGLALGAVSGIAAQRRYQLVVRGVAGHAGTNAMSLRRDALTGAAEIILAAERIARGGAPDLVATVGRMQVAPGAVNVVPGEARFSLDVRAGRPDARDGACRAILAEAESICRARGLGLEVDLIQDLAASPCDPGLTGLLEESLRRTGRRNHTLVSGAGHDAMAIAQLCPTAMLFIRCEKGVSHNPAESASAEDAEAALQVMMQFLELLEERFDA